MPDESNYGCPDCGAAMSECYNEVVETVTRNRSYPLSFDSNSPTHPDRGDDDGDSSRNDDPEEDDQGVRCNDCGHQFRIGEFVRITGFVPRPYPERSKECDGVASQFTSPALRHFMRSFHEHGIFGVNVEDRFYKNALRLFLQVPIPFAVPAKTITAVKKALRDHSPRGVTRRTVIWTEIGELFNDHYSAVSCHEYNA